MSGPWEKYAAQTAPAAEQGPWTRYQQPAAPNATEPTPKTAPFGMQAMGNVGGGLIRGAGSIGATILAPYDMAKDALAGKGLSLESNDERRAAMDAGMRALGVDTNSFGYGMGKLGGEVAGTLGAGPLLGGAAKALGAAPAVSQALATGGMQAGGATGLGGLALRTAAGAATGGVSAGMVDPRHAATGAAVGGALPVVATGLGQLGFAGGRAAAGSGGGIAETLQPAAQSARDAGYNLPPSMVNPSMMNRTLEGIAGKQSVGQELSARNQETTNALIRKALGMPDGAPITPEALDAIRAEAGKAYGAIADLGPINARGARLPSDVAVRDFTDPLLQRRVEVDAGELVRAWKQANHDATAYYRAYGRDANPETLAKAKAASSAAKQIDDFMASSLQGMGRSDMLEALKAARVRIAKTYGAEAALQPATGNIEAAKLANQLQRGKPLSGEMRQVAEFAGAFPTAAKMPEKMGSLPGLTPLDWTAAGATSLATGSPMGLISLAARPAARAALMSGPVQNGLTAPPASLLASPESRAALEALFVRGLPVAATAGP